MIVDEKASGTRHLVVAQRKEWRCQRRRLRRTSLIGAIGFPPSPLLHETGESSLSHRSVSYDVSKHVKRGVARRYALTRRQTRGRPTPLRFHIPGHCNRLSLRLCGHTHDGIGRAESGKTTRPQSDCETVSLSFCVLVRGTAKETEE